MTSEADWIKEVSKTYLEEAWKASAVANAGKKPSYVKGKKEEVKEEAEQIDELSKKTLGSYIRLAAHDAAAKTADATIHDDMMGAPGTSKKIVNRHKGIARAVSKLTNEDTEECGSCLEESSKITKENCVEYMMDANDLSREEAERRCHNMKLKEESTITNEQLLESFQHLSEEQFDALTDKYLTHLSENYTEDQIAAMTEEQLQEGLMDFARGLVKTGVEKAKELGGKVKQGIKDIEQKGAVAGFEAEKSKIRKGGSQAGHHLQQLAAGKALGSTGASGQQEIRPEDEQLHQSLASAYDKSVKQRTKGLGGFAAKVKGKLTGKSAEDVIRSGDEAKLAKLQKAGAIKGAELAGRYRSGTQKAAQQKLAALRGQIAKYKKLAGDTE